MLNIKPTHKPIKQYYADGDSRRQANDSQYIFKLISKVITVSLETVDIIENLPAL